MAFVSVTRLRVRSIRYLLSFSWQVVKTARQAQRSSGFLGGVILREANNVCWTVTAWEDQKSMLDYRNAGAHRTVMPRLLDWCDEASVAHWNQEHNDLPDWQEAHRRIAEEGRRSKVKHPSPAHLANQIALPRPGLIQRTLTRR